MYNLLVNFIYIHMENSKKVYSIIIGVVLVALVVFGIYSIFKKPTSYNQNNTEKENSATITEKNTSKIYVDDQFPGSVVFLSSVTLPKGGFVVVHTDDNGKLGKIIGSKYFEAGTNTGDINLSELSKEGKNYWVVLYEDDGDKIFNFAKDLPIKNASGDIIMTKFKATEKFVEQKG